MQPNLVRKFKTLALIRPFWRKLDFGKPERKFEGYILATGHNKSLFF